ncbi:MAG: AraC family ligand binding domain-containing protein [Solirubrobacteraceae bacterium]|nr:AraC family ligand binding domain-containing protein [Solirubrobacteraceae bacterium]
MDVWQLDSIDVEPRRPKVLHSDEGAARVIAIDLPAGDGLAEHQVHEHAWLHVHRGVVDVICGGETHRADAGTLIHWSPSERHTVNAVEDARLTLVLAPWPGEGHPSTRE